MYEINWSGSGHDVEGGYLTKNCNILVEGVWNGLKYTPVELAKSANKWRDNTVWNRHYEGRQRDERNRIGILQNQHFVKDRIVGDIFLSNSTPEGREMISLVKECKVRGISVEHVDEGIIDGTAIGISFLGLAIVPTPACKICNLSKTEELEMEEKEINELKGTVAELEKEVKELRKVNVATVVEDKYEPVIKSLEKRIKELEDIPDPNTVTGGEQVDDSYAGLVIEHGASRRSNE